MRTAGSRNRMVVTIPLGAWTAVVQEQDAVADPGRDDAGQHLPGEPGAEQLAQENADAQLDVTDAGAGHLLAQPPDECRPHALQLPGPGDRQGAQRRFEMAVQQARSARPPSRCPRR
jgi:hypothetical protein